MDTRVFLAQTDTTVGLLSQDAKKLNKIKKRPINQAIIITSPYLEELKRKARVPNTFKNKIRKAKKSTFIYQNGISFRLIFGTHRTFYKDFNLKWVFSTSANFHKQRFDKSIEKQADIVLKPFFESKPSKIFRINRTQIKKLR